VVAQGVREVRRDVESNPSKQFMERLVEFLREKKHAPDPGGEVLVRRHEIGEVARGVGLDEEEGWSKFMALNGTAWVGKPVVRSEERGYTAVLLVWVDGE
jgi:hypothetical protein